MGPVTVEQAILAVAGAMGVFLVATGWALVTSRPFRIALVTLGLLMVAAVATYAIAPVAR